MSPDAQLLPNLSPYRPADVWWPGPVTGAIYRLSFRGRLPRYPVLRDLTRVTSRELLRERNFGPKSLAMVRCALESAGLALADDAPGYTLDDESDEVLMDMLPTRRGARRGQ